MSTRTATEAIIQKTGASWRAATLGLLVIISVMMALFASFGLHEWAEASTLHHGIQHVLLFSGGVGVGVVIASLLKGRRG